MAINDTLDVITYVEYDSRMRGSNSGYSDVEGSLVSAILMASNYKPWLVCCGPKGYTVIIYLYMKAICING